MRKTILLDALEGIITEVEKMRPYKVVGRTDSYSSYNEGWSDACDILGNEILDLVKQYASAPKEGLQWVNASERLPKRDGWVHIRNTDTNPSTIYYKVGDYMPPSFKWLDESSASESGGEGKDEMELLDNHLSLMTWWIDKIGIDNTETTRGAAKIKIGSALKRMFDFVPSVQSSDVTPVASHSSTSSNSIEQELIKAQDEYIDLLNTHLSNVQGFLYAHRVKWDKQTADKCKIVLSKIEDLKSKLCQK